MNILGITSKLSWLCILLLMSSCARNNIDGKLIFREANADSGYNFPYFLYLPSETDTTGVVPLIVEPNNTGFPSDDFQEHVNKAERSASLKFYTGNYVAQKLKIPLLVPVFPRPEKDWHIYTHAFDRDLALQKGNILERLDLQLLAMIDDAVSYLKREGYSIDDKFFLTGFSASGTFANRFTAIHPEKIKAVAAGGLNGLLILPVTEAGGSVLNFPLGVNDFPMLFGKNFDRSCFRNTPQYWYMGDVDDNDAIPFDDGYGEEEKEIIYMVLGKEMQPLRWNACRKIYEEEKIKADIKTFKGYGHEHPQEIMDEIVNFFSNHMND